MKRSFFSDCLPMSPREQIQKDLTEYLENRTDKWTAPYGILPGMEAFPKGGKIRTITFGVARSLDATLFIWSPSRFTFRAEGPLAYKLKNIVCNSVDDVISVLTNL